MDRSETYLYGVLLALAREQIAAFDRSEAGRLSRWGQYRSEARTAEMAKFANKILQQKSESGAAHPLDEIAMDIALIARNGRPWEDITPREIELVRHVLSQV